MAPKVSGGEFAGAFARRVLAEVDGQQVSLIRLEDLIANKKTSGRLKDLADVEQPTLDNR
jgi:predicted nucleotidyltransferase